MDVFRTNCAVVATVLALGGCTAPRMLAPQDTDPYYAPASVRLGQSGSVVLRFSIGPDGKAREPIRHDEPVVVSPGYDAPDARAGARLIEGAEKYIRDAKFAARGIHKRQVTASFVFELKPCGALKHSRIHDYAISLCRERPAPIRVPLASEKAPQTVSASR